MSLEKRSLTLSGHRTSVALEPEFWRVLEAWAAHEKRSVSEIVVAVDVARGTGHGLASALRVAVLRRLESTR